MDKCSKEVFYLTALNADDILRDIDPASADRAHSCSSSLNNIDIPNGTLNFVTRCAGSRNTHEQRIQLFDFNYIVPEEEREFLEPNWDKLKADYPELLNSELKLHCTCPYFVYGGYQYIGTELDYVLESEPRFPEQKNPSLTGTVCKHLISILRRFFV